MNEKRYLYGFLDDPGIEISNNCFVCELYNLIADEELYPEHLRDVVEDYLAAYNPEDHSIQT